MPLNQSLIVYLHFLTIACKTHLVKGPNCAWSSDFILFKADAKESSEEHFKVV